MQSLSLEYNQTMTKLKTQSAGNTLSTRERILLCARQITMEQGATNLTIDSVAERSGLSKGGVLYHFPSKKALMSAMIQQYADLLESRLQQGMRRHKEAFDPLLPGYASWFTSFSKNDQGSRSWGSSLFAVHSFDPKLLEPLAAWYQQLAERVRSSPVQFEDAAIIILALEGLFYLKLFDLDALTSEEHQRIICRLLEMAHPADVGQH